jgi:uncharacterized cupredoxin-like copper-binding protein/predicted ester cyclase
MSESVARQAIDAVNTALATGDSSRFDAVFAPDVAGHPPHRSLVTGEAFSHDLAGLTAGLADIRRFFPDASLTIDDLIAADDAVAARVTFRGTLDTTALGGEEEHNRRLEIGGLLFGEISDGRIVEFWAYFDPSVYADLAGMSPTAALTAPESDDRHVEADHATNSMADSTQIEVALSEFRIEASPSTLHVGEAYTFVVTNEGSVPHEFVIEQAGATHEPLESGDQEAMIHAIAIGERAMLSWTFAEPGSYQLACHQPGHYEAGQVVLIEVEG